MKIKLMISVTILLLLTACSPFAPVSTPDVNTYQLQTYSHKQLSAYPHRSILLVATPTTHATYQTTAMLYTEGDHQIQKFAKNRWIASPAQMLLPLIVTSLRNTNYFKAVVAPPIASKTDYQLTTQILEFQQYFTETNSYFKMTLLESLINTRTSRVIAQRRFSASVTAMQNNPEAGVIAANEATAQILNRLVSWVVSVSKY